MIVTVLLFLWLSPVTLLSDARPAIHETAAAVTQEENQQSSIQKLVGSLTKYYVGHFTMGPNWSADPGPKFAEGKKKGRELLATYVKEGKIVGAAEAKGKSATSLIVFFKTATEAEAWAIINEFPGVKSGFYKGKVAEVWGTRGLGQKISESLKAGETLATKPFYLAVTTKGKNWKEKPSEAQLKTAEAGATNALKMMEAGKVKFYAAFTGSGDPRNIAIFEAASPEEAKKMAQGPLVDKKWFSVQVVQCTVLEGTLP